MPYMRNKRTGEMIEVDDRGMPVSRAPAPPMNPEFPFKGPQAQADLTKTNVGTANTQANTTRTQVQTQGDVLDNTNKTRTIQQNPISDRDQAFINGIRQQQGDLSGVLRDIGAAQEAVDRFQPSPGRGKLYGMGTVEDDDWPITALAKGAVGMFLPDQGQEDYQRLARLQSQGVLNSQIAQKGPQTESDAARMKLAGVSPNKSVANNAQLLAEQQYDVMMKQNLPGFYETWANRLGSTHALNKQGKSADQVWTEQYQRGLGKMRADPRFRRATGLTGAPRAGGKVPKPSGVIDFNDWGN